MWARLPKFPRRLRLGTLLVGLNSGLVLVALVGLAWAGIRLLESLADEQALARVRMAGAAARAALERSGQDATTSAQILAERPTLQRLVREGDRAGLDAFVDRFRRTSHLSGVSVFLDGERFAGSGDGSALPSAIVAIEVVAWTFAIRAPSRPAMPGTSDFAEGGATAKEALSDPLSLVAVAPILAIPRAWVQVERRLDDLYLRQIAQQAGLPVSLAASVAGQAGASPVSRDEIVAARNAGGQAYVARASVVDSVGKSQVSIETRLSRASVAGPLSRLVRRLVAAALGIAVLASAAGLWITGRITGPVRALTSAAVRLGRGDLATPVPRVTGAEIGGLAETLEETRRQLGRLTSELRRQKAEGEAILTGVAEGVFSVDRDRRIVYLNPQAAALLGIRSEEALGRFCGDVLRPFGSGGLRPCEEECPIVHARSRGAARATERLRLADGTIRTVIVTSSAPAEDRQFQVLADETEQEAAGRLRDAVLANISHEFKTPLAGQRASLELLRERLLGSPATGEEEGGDVDPETLALVSALERGGLRLTQLIDNLLESVRIEAGSPPLRRGAVALDEVIEEAAEVARPLLAQRRQGLEIDLPYPMPEVAGDAPRLIQVFVNLLANANKFAPEGSVVRIGGVVEAPVVRLWVEDEGPGMPTGNGETAAPSLFERFVRSPERQADPEASGMGLGLWIVQSIVERHSGRVELSRWDGRSRVVVELPAIWPLPEPVAKEGA